MRKNYAWILFWGSIIFCFMTILLLQEVEYTYSQSLNETSSERVTAEIILDVHGTLHGITFDHRGHMFVARKGKEIYKVSPEGNASLFAIVEEAKGWFIQGYGDTFIYDLKMGPDDALYAAAEDRVLRITADGTVSTLIQETFGGRYGACGLTFDQEGNMYVSYHNKVARYTPTLEKTVLLDGDTSEMSLNAAIGIVFDPQSQVLFICDDRLRKVIKFPLSIDDSSNNRVVEYTDLPFDPEYLTIDDAQNVIVSSPSSNTLVVIAPTGNRKLIECDNIMRYVIGIETIAIGGKGFDKKSVYATGWDGGHVYKIPLPAFEDE